MVNSRQGPFTAPVFLQAPFSLSYGVILQSSLTRVLSLALVLLHSDTCVGLRYGHFIPYSLRSFSWHHGFRDLSVRGPSRCISAYMPGGFSYPNDLEYTNGHSHSSASLILMRPSITSINWCRNFNLLCIAYVFRLQLSSRLTLGGRPFPRNPYLFGGWDSHPSYRYSCRHPHFPYLQHSFRCTFYGLGNAPLPFFRIRSFGGMF